MLSLSDKELIFLAVMLGENNFYGIKDPFRGMEEKEIWAEIPDIQLGLEKKGYVNLKFDDSVAIKPEVQNLISVCSQCEKYLIIDSIMYGKLQNKCILYLRDEKAVVLKQNVSGWEVKSVKPVDFILELQDKLAAQSGKFSELNETILLEQDILAQVSQQTDDKQALDILQNAGCSLDMVEVLLAGVRRNCTYCSVQIFDIKAKSIQTLNCLFSEQGNLQIVPLEIEGVTKWQITWLKNVSDLFTNMVEMFLGDDYNAPL